MPPLRPWLPALVCLLATSAALAQHVVLETPSFVWELSETGRTVSLLDRDTRRELSVSSQPAFTLVTEDGTFEPERVRLDGDQLAVRFAEGAGECRFKVASGKRHLTLKLSGLETKAPLTSLTLCRLFVPREGKVAGLVNAWRGPEQAVAVMGLSPAVRPGGGRGPRGSGGSASPGAKAEAAFTNEAKAGSGAARLVGLNPTDKPAWTCRYKTFARPLDLRGHVGIGAWVKGDGKGELLKIQLYDGKGAGASHYRDYYIKIDFTGWKYCELKRPEGEPIDYGHITQCNLYYNGIPPKTNVECVVDDIRALRELTGKPSSNPQDWILEDFEDPAAPYYDLPATVISADCLAQYGTEGAGVGVIVCPAEQLTAAIEELELAAGLPSPHFNGAWSKTSPDVQRSYLFITRLSAEDTDDVIEFARRGGFSAILIGQWSWTTSVGHFPINTRNFPRGIQDLKQTVRKFQAAGFRCGLHFHGPSISNNDAYVTPVPDDRLVMDRFAELAADVSAEDSFIPATAAPEGWPPHEGGYRGDSAILRIGDELVSYGSLSLEAPSGFADCKRGFLGTKASAHEKADRIAHVKRSYGYFLHDADTTLTAEVAGNLARVANAVGANMLYFDGSERLQGPHWHYNAKIHKAYWDALGRTDTLLQASSVSHFSYHILSRHASADGGGDIKRYLDERLPRLRWYFDNLLPLDLGWYYIYGGSATPDQIEYVCQKALGLGCSVGIQTNPTMIREHPRMDEFIRIIRSYEDLRLSGEVSEEMRARLRVPGEEYLLSVQDGKHRFPRVTYSDEMAVVPETEAPALRVTVDPKLGEPHLGLEVRAGQQVAPGPDYNDPQAWLLEDFEDLTPYGAKGAGEWAKYVIGSNQAGNTSEGVTQKFESITEGAKLGQRCGKYTAVSTRTDNGGWSAIGRRLDPPLDLREHVGLGVWICGDGSGAQFKIQPRGPKGNAQDYYIPINFTGWRFFVLKRPDKPWPEPITYDGVKYLTFYYNGIPAGKTCTVLVDGLKALRTLTETTTPAPTFVLGGKSLTFDARLGLDDCLLYRGGPSATLKRPGEKARAVTAEGTLAPLPAGENEISVVFPDDREQLRELLVRALLVYD